VRAGAADPPLAKEVDQVGGPVGLDRLEPLADGVVVALQRAVPPGPPRVREVGDVREVDREVRLPEQVVAVEVGVVTPHLAVVVGGQRVAVHADGVDGGVLCALLFEGSVRTTAWPPQGSPSARSRSS